MLCDLWGGRDISRCRQGSRPGEGAVEPKLWFLGSSWSYLTQPPELATSTSQEGHWKSVTVTGSCLRDRALIPCTDNCLRMYATDRS